MAVTSLKELAAGRAGDEDDTSKREYRRFFQVRTDSPGDGPKVIRAALDAAGVGIASTYRSYLDGESDLQAFCNKVDCEPQDNEPLVWRVTVGYSTEIINPLDEPVEIAWTMEPYQKALERDFIGSWILNSAGDPFDPPPVVDYARLVLTIERNEAVDDPAKMRAYQNAVSGDVFFDMPAGEWKIVQIGCRKQFRGIDISWWRWTYQFHHNPEGWRLKLLDAGYRYYNSVKGDWVDITDLQGRPVQQPALLDGNGQPLARVDPPVYVQVPNGFQIYPVKMFADLDLP